MPHVHLLVGLICANILVFGGDDHSNSIWFILGSVLPDIDFIFNLIIEKNSHRQLLTHFPVIYLSGALLLGILGLPLCWFFLGALGHTIVDVIDWEIYLFAPFSKKPFTILGLDYEKMATKGSANLLKKYYQEKRILVLELFVLFLWIITSFL